MKLFLKGICFLFIIPFFLVNSSFGQNVAGFDAYLLTAPPAHDCNGIIRFEFHTCECLNNYGIDITINGDGSWCGVGSTCSFNQCTGTGTVDKSFPPGEYDIVGTVNSGAGCTNSGQVFKKHVTIPNPECTPGFLTYEVVQAPGYQCNGKIEKIFYTPVNCIAYNYVDIYLVDANGNESWIDHPNIYGSSVGVAPGTYKLKVKESNGCTVEKGGIVIANPPCPKLSLKYDPIDKVGFSCMAQLKNFTVATDKQPCLGLNYYDMLIYDENKNLIFGPDHPDHPINVNLASGHRYYLECKLFFGQCTSGLQVLNIGPAACKGRLKATNIIPESNPGCHDGSIELKYNSPDCFTTWYANATAHYNVISSNIAYKDDKVTLSGLSGDTYEIRSFETSNASACGTPINVTVPTLNNNCDLQLAAVANNKCPGRITVKLHAGPSVMNNPCITEIGISIFNAETSYEQTYTIPKVADIKLPIDNLPGGTYSIVAEIPGCLKNVYATISNCNAVPTAGQLVDDKKVLPSQQGSNAPHLIIWPNPANQQLNIQLQEDLAKGKIIVQLIDGTGRIIKQWAQQNNYKASAINLELADIVGGLYFIVINDSNGKKLRGKVLIQH